MTAWEMLRGVGFVLVLASCTDVPRTQPGPPSDPAQALSREPTPGFVRIEAPRRFEFPRDHGPHPRTQTEWWYITGNLSSEDGREFGYQFTIFRLGVVPPDQVEDGSAWAVGDLYMAHLAVSDVSAQRFIADQRLARPALALAGAVASPFRVWLEGWEIESAGPDAFFPLSIEAGTSLATRSTGEQAEIELELDRGKPIVLHGDRGYSRKGPDAGDASHYYSFTRMPTRGTITIDGERHSVTGNSWLDHEWSTSVLSRSQRGWDWFGLQLADGRELMVFELRSDTPGAAILDGTLVFEDGSTLRLERSDVELEVIEQWTSGLDGTRYPAAWRLTVPEHRVDLRIEAAFGDQEHSGIFRYWEGSVTLFAPDGSPAGRGYVELTGYAGDAGKGS